MSSSPIPIIQERYFYFEKGTAPYHFPLTPEIRVIDGYISLYQHEDDQENIYPIAIGIASRMLCDKLVDGWINRAHRQSSSGAPSMDLFVRMEDCTIIQAYNGTGNLLATKNQVASQIWPD